MSTNLRLAGFLLVIAFAALSGCSKTENAAQPTPQAEDQTILAYKKLVEESKARIAAAAAAASQPGRAAPEPVDAYQVERWLSNLGYQRNLAARIRQDINLFALLVPEMEAFAQSGRYDKAYLANGILNKPLVDVASKSLYSTTTTDNLVRANSVVIADPFRSFVIDFSSSFYEGHRFLKFLSEPLDASQWRVDAILKFNQLTSFDRTQLSILGAVAPVLMTRFPVRDDSARRGLVQKLSATLALYRTAWAVKELTDEQLYRLILSASAPDVVATFAATDTAIDTASVALAADMNAAFPPTLVSKTTSPLASIGDQPR